MSLLGFPGKVQAKFFERKYREILKSKLEEGQCSFCPSHSTIGSLLASSESGLKQA